MAKIDDIHKQIRLYLNKQQSGWISPEEIDEAVYMASKALFEEVYEDYEKNIKVSTDLQDFKSDPTTLALDGSGLSNKPADYQYYTSITSGTDLKDVDIIDENFLASRLNDAICPPATAFPICVFYNTKIQFYPIGLTDVKMTYLKTPVAPRWGYTLPNGLPVFAETGGVTGDTIDIEWGEVSLNKVAVKALKVLGVNLREDQIVGFAENTDIKGDI